MNQLTARGWMGQTCSMRHRHVNLQLLRLQARHQRHWQQHLGNFFLKVETWDRCFSHRGVEHMLQHVKFRTNSRLFWQIQPLNCEIAPCFSKLERWNALKSTLSCRCWGCNWRSRWIRVLSSQCQLLINLVVSAACIFICRFAGPRSDQLKVDVDFGLRSHGGPGPCCGPCCGHTSVLPITGERWLPWKQPSSI